MTPTDKMAEALRALLKRDERNTCQHEETHRGGSIWTICDACGQRWADDEGGMPKWRDPPEWVAARAALAEHEAAAPATAPTAPVTAEHLPEHLILAVDRWFSDNVGMGGCGDQDVADLAAIFWGVHYDGGRESVDDALAVVDSFGPGVGGLNDTFARQILLADEVKRLRAAIAQSKPQARLRAWLMTFPGSDGSESYVEIGEKQPEPNPPFVAEALYSLGGREAASPAAPAQGAEPVATLHDDGSFSWKCDEFRRKFDRQRAGWRMDVYAFPVPPAQAVPLTDAARDVLAERRRQVDAEGWTPEHDDEHDDGAMAQAAGCYALWGRAYPVKGMCPSAWPWQADDWKPKTHRANCVRAAALLLAEIERLDRAAHGITGDQHVR